MFEVRRGVDYVRSTLTSARELGDAVERSGECQTEHLQCVVRPLAPVARRCARTTGSTPYPRRARTSGAALADLHSEFTLRDAVAAGAASAAARRRGMGAAAAACWRRRRRRRRRRGLRRRRRRRLRRRGEFGYPPVANCEPRASRGGGRLDPLRCRVVGARQPHAPLDLARRRRGERGRRRRRRAQGRVVHRPAAAPAGAGVREQLAGDQCAGAGAGLCTAGGAVVSAFSPSSSYGLHSVDAAGGDREQVSRRVTTDTQSRASTGATPARRRSAQRASRSRCGRPRRSTRRPPTRTPRRGRTCGRSHRCPPSRQEAGGRPSRASARGSSTRGRSAFDRASATQIQRKIVLARVCVRSLYQVRPRRPRLAPPGKPPSSASRRRACAALLPATPRPAIRRSRAAPRARAPAHEYAARRRAPPAPARASPTR